MRALQCLAANFQALGSVLLSAWQQSSKGLAALALGLADAGGCLCRFLPRGESSIGLMTCVVQVVADRRFFAGQAVRLGNVHASVVVYGSEKEYLFLKRDKICAVFKKKSLTWRHKLESKTWKEERYIWSIC